MPNDRPNFLMICTDQMRADHMGCDGNPAIRTPNLDRIASEGVHFTRGYVNNPLCMPSRSTMLTGMTPRGHGVRTNGISLDPRIPTITQALRDTGYRTASVGKIHVTPYTLHPEVSPKVSDPYEFPECEASWEQGTVDHVPTPYYGFEHVELTISHGNGVRGDYMTWLQQNHPDAYDVIRQRRLNPSPLGAQDCAVLSFDAECHHSAYVADRTMAWLRDRDASAPFFMQCSFPDPHHPYHVPEPWASMYSPDDVVPPVARDGELDDLAPFFRQVANDCPQLSGRNRPTAMSDAHRREILAHTYGMVSLVDHHVGRVLDYLDEQGLADNTVVVFTSDHGDMMGDHALLNKGPFHFEGLLRVPTIWRCPGRIAPRQSDALASLLDFAPTVMDLAGVPVPEGPASPEAPQQPPAWPGRSLAPVLTGAADTVQDSVIVENDEDYLGLRLRTLITSTHKLTTYTAVDGPASFGELFDLANDPHELHNLWDKEPTLRRELTEQLHYRLTQTDNAVPRRLSHA
ncbi:MAG: sulfatase-like hydrolase/transferase [bacterium]|nr:sulfatase-like hydrolase/transferase [bacterium]